MGHDGTLRPTDVHILLVDDDKIARLVVGNLLRKGDYTGAACACGRTQPCARPVAGHARGPADRRRPACHELAMLVAWQRHTSSSRGACTPG